MPGEEAAVDDFISTLGDNGVENSDEVGVTPPSEFESEGKPGPETKAEPEATTASTDPETEEKNSSPEPDQSGSDDDDKPKLSEAELSEKRRKDTERSFQRERQARLQLEKEKADLEAALQDKLDAIDNEEVRRKLEEAPADTILELVTEQQRKLVELEQKSKQDIAAQIEADRVIREEMRLDDVYGDYYDTVEPIADRLTNEHDPLTKKFVEAGKTPEAAYKLAKDEARAAKILKDPDAYKQQLKEELLAELSGETPPANEKTGKKPKPIGKAPTKKGAPPKTEASIAGYNVPGENNLPDWI